MWKSSYGTSVFFILSKMPFKVQDFEYIQRELLTLLTSFKKDPDLIDLKKVVTGYAHADWKKEDMAKDIIEAEKRKPVETFLRRQKVLVEYLRCPF